MEVGLSREFGVTRRGFLRAAGAGAAWVALAGAVGCGTSPREGGAASSPNRASVRGLSLPASGPVRTLRSRPDFEPPAVTVSVPATGNAARRLAR